MSNDMQPYVERIYIAPEAGKPMQRVSQIEAIIGRGLLGDRYYEGSGFYKGQEACQVTLIQGESLDEIAETKGLSVHDGQHRRNIVTRGVDLNNLEGGEQICIGDAILQYWGPKPPCHYLEELTQQPGMTRALVMKSGICTGVIKSGTIREEDTIVLIPKMRFELS